MSQHRSVWLATAEPPARPALDGEVAVDVAVVGGGITGLTTALLLQRAGASVAVVEGATAGGGTTGHTTGKVTSQHGLLYDRLIRRHGERRARGYAEAGQQAIEVVAALAAEVGDGCGFTRAPAFAYTLQPSRREAIEAEHRAAARLGLPAGTTTDVDLPFPVELALRFDHQAHLHPGRYVAGLAAAVEAAGGRVYERSRALELEEQRDAAIVRTGLGRVRAGHVVVATLLPVFDRGGFFAKARPTRAYGIAARLAGGGITGMHLDVGSPTRSTRPWSGGGGPGIVVVGEGHPTGQGAATPGRWGELERWTRHHFDVAAFEHRWSAQDYTTIDDLPYVGRSPRARRTFVATGFRGWGLTGGTAAAQVLADLVQGRPNPWAEVFDATRIGGPRAIAKGLAENLDVGRLFVGDRLGRLGVRPARDLARGEGAWVEVRGRTVGGYRDPAGRLHVVSPTCTHLGCTLRWNAAETSWDCPCHGSRFSHQGEVLEGPAVQPLDRVEVDDSP